MATAHGAAAAADVRTVDVAVAPRLEAEAAAAPGDGDRGATARRLLTHRRAVVAAIVLGIALRLLAALVIGQGGEIHEFGVIGENVVTGRGFSYYAVDGDGTVARDLDHTGRPLPSAFMPPLYTVAVGGAFGATSSNQAAVGLIQVVQAFAAGLAIAAVAWLARSLFGTVAGALAAFGYACYPALIYQTTQVSASNLYLLLEIVALGCLVAASRRSGLRWPAVAALALGAVGILRAEAVLMVVLAAAWLAWSRRRQGLDARKAAALVLALGLVLPVGWTIRNSIALERFVPTLTTSGGLNLWLGNAEGATGGIGEPPMPAELRERLDALPGTTDYEVQRDDTFRAAAIEAMKADPVAVLRRDVRKAFYMATVDLNDHRARNPLAVLPWLVIAVLGVLGIAKVPLDRDWRVLLFGYLGFTVVVAMGFFALGRFKLAIEYPMIVFAAAYVAQRLGAPTRPAVVDDAAAPTAS